MASVIRRVFLMLLIRPFNALLLPSMTIVPRVTGDRTFAGTNATTTEAISAATRRNARIFPRVNATTATKLLYAAV